MKHISINKWNLFAGLILLFVIGTALLWCAGHHVIRTRHGTAVVPKRFLTFENTFVDARRWKVADYRAHAEIRGVLLQHGYGDILLELQHEELRARFETLAAEADLKLEEIKVAVLAKAVQWLETVRGYWSPEK